MGRGLEARVVCLKMQGYAEILGLAEVGEINVPVGVVGSGGFDGRLFQTSWAQTVFDQVGLGMKKRFLRPFCLNPHSCEPVWVECLACFGSEGDRFEAQKVDLDAGHVFWGLRNRMGSGREIFEFTGKAQFLALRTYSTGQGGAQSKNEE
jgi:hypothetical protein